MRKVKYGDIILSDDHNTLVDYADAVDKDLDALALAEVNLTKVSGVEQTGADWTPLFENLNWVGAYRFKQIYTSSGWTSVPAGTVVEWLSVSGTGILQCVWEMGTSGFPAKNSIHWIVLDGSKERSINLPRICDLPDLGMDAEGNYTLGRVFIRVARWAPVAHDYRKYRYSDGVPSFYRSSLVSRHQNTSDTDGTMINAFHYFLFTASKRLLMKFPSYRASEALKKRLADAKIPFQSIFSMRLGYYEAIEDHPYPDFLTDLPSEWDQEVGPAKTKSASEAKQNFVCEIYVPEEVPTDSVARELKPLKLLYEEIL